jgi:hypothetical protein
MIESFLRDIWGYVRRDMYLWQFVELEALLISIDINEPPFHIQYPIVIFMKGTGHFTYQLFKVFGLGRFDLVNFGLEFGQFNSDDFMAENRAAMVTFPIALQKYKKHSQNQFSDKLFGDQKFSRVEITGDPSTCPVRWQCNHCLTV